MAKYKITGPDGASYVVNAPDDASEADVMAYAQQNFGASQPKERSWSDVPMDALKNAPDSAVRTAQAIAYPFMHPIDTLKGMRDIGHGLVSKAAGAVGIEQDPQWKAETEAPANAVGQFLKDRYGSVDALKNTLAEDPIGALMDASVVLSGGGALAARAPGVVGKAGQAVSKVASAIDPIANAGRVAKLGGKAASSALGMTTGAGGIPIETAFKAGRAGNQTFIDHMRGSAPATDVLDMAQEAVQAYGKDRGAAYRSSIGSLKESTKPVNYKPVIDALTDAKSMISLKGMDDLPKSKAAADVYNEINQTVRDFALHPAAQTAEGLDALKQAIGEIQKKTQYGTLERKVSGEVFNATKNEIVKQVPEYAKTMKDYANASEQITDLTKTFSLGEKASKDTAIRKLTSVMRNNVNTNFGERARLMDVLAKKQPDLPAAIAGQALNSPTPRGLQNLVASAGVGYGAATVNPMALALLPFASPRLVGEATYKVGQGVGAAEKVARALKLPIKDIPKAALPAYVAGVLGQSANAPLRGGIGPRYDENGQPR